MNPNGSTPSRGIRQWFREKVFSKLTLTQFLYACSSGVGIFVAYRRCRWRSTRIAKAAARRGCSWPQHLGFIDRFSSVPREDSYEMFLRSGSRGRFVFLHSHPGTGKSHTVLEQLQLRGENFIHVPSKGHPYITGETRLNDAVLGSVLGIHSWQNKNAKLILQHVVEDLCEVENRRLLLVFEDPSHSHNGLLEIALSLSQSDYCDVIVVESDLNEIQQITHSFPGHFDTPIITYQPPKIASLLQTLEKDFESGNLNLDFTQQSAFDLIETIGMNFGDLSNGFADLESGMDIQDVIESFISKAEMIIVNSIDSFDDDDYSLIENSLKMALEEGRVDRECSAVRHLTKEGVFRLDEGDDEGFVFLNRALEVGAERYFVGKACGGVEILDDCQGDGASVMDLKQFSVGCFRC